VVVAQQIVYQKGVTKSSLLSGTRPQEKDMEQLQNQIISVFPMMKSNDPGCGEFESLAELEFCDDDYDEE
jgi:hypothetical protein